MSSRLLDLLPHIIVAVEVKKVRDEIQSILIELNFGVETSQVESIRQVLFVNLAEVLVAAR